MEKPSFLQPSEEPNMKIAGAQFTLSASHVLRRQYVREETLSLRVPSSSRGRPAPRDAEERTRPRSRGAEERTRRAGGSLHALLDALRGTMDGSLGGLLNKAAPSAEPAARGIAETPEQSLDLAPDPVEKAKIQILLAALEKLTGKSFEPFDPSVLWHPAAGGGVDTEPSAAEPPVPVRSADPPSAAEQVPRWGVEYTLRERYQESEISTFRAQGVVKTEDGREIDVQVDLTMTRRFVTEHRIDLRAGAAALHDPLVIDFPGSAAELTQRRFQFDLDADGRQDRVRLAGPGSAFLAVDRNDNGIIDDGSELFGPSSGDGFRELATYDVDGNQWIDERDPVFAHLRLWTRDVAGHDQLSGLPDRGIGAIFLGQTPTPFSLKDSANRLQGAVRASGVYLNEDGTAGAVRQLDLVI